MGGNHKKNLRAEKAKVKLKGATLPKGLNVTKTEFKVRKIVIRDQLRDVQIIEGQRQLNLKEALTRVKHHTSSLRSEGLRNLKDILTSGHNDIHGQLSNIIQTIASICLDVEHETRKESFKTLSTLLEVLDEDTISPFFHILSSYLRCAMTHIQPKIQEDSLTMLDVLLENVPNLVASQSEKIFQNFLEMISRERSEGNTMDRSLTTNMNQQQTTIKWRVKVLLRLKDMLKTLVDYRKLNSSGTGGNTNSYKTISFKINEPQHYGVFRAYKDSMCNMESVFTRSIGLSGKAGSLGPDQGSILMNYIELLMPLLLESWLEVSPHKNASNMQLLLTSDAAITMQVILDIVKSLWNLVDLHENDVKSDDLSIWFSNNYGKKFSDYFLMRFPYQQNAQSEESKGKKSKKGKEKVARTKDNCALQNMILTYLSCRFMSSDLSSYDMRTPSLMNFMNKSLKHLDSLTSEDQLELSLSLNQYLNLNGVKLIAKYNNGMQELLQSTLDAFLENKFSFRDGVSAQILVLLCEIIQKKHLFNNNLSVDFTKFLEYLPRLLLKQTITINSLMAMQNLGKQKNAVFLNALEPLLPQVIENIPKMQVTGAINAFEGKKLIINLFYWTEHRWDGQQLTEKVMQHITDKRIASYLKYIINNK